MRFIAFGNLKITGMTAVDMAVLAMLPLLTLCNGGIFSSVFLPAAVLLVLVALFAKKIVVSIPELVAAGGMVLLYFFAALFGRYDKGIAFVETCRVLLLLLGVVLGCNAKKEVLAAAVVLAASLLAIIGILSVCKVLHFPDSVYIVDGLRRLQSTMQYANSTAIFLIAGGLCIRFMMCNGKRLYPKALLDVLLTVCLFFTYSKTAILIYVILLVVELVFTRKDRWLFLLAQFGLGLLVFALMHAFVQNKMSFYALLTLAIVPMLACQFTVQIKPVRLTKNWATVGIILGVNCAVVGMAFLDISTFMIRLLYDRDGLVALLHHPLLGLSPGGWAEGQFQFQTAQYFVRYAHNGYLQAGLDAGLPAMLVFIGLVVFALVRRVKALRMQRTDFDLYALLLLMAFAIHGFFDFDFSFANILLLFGMASVVGYKQGTVMPAVPMKAVLCAVVIVPLLYLNVTEGVLLTAKTQQGRGDTVKAADTYRLLCALRPFDVDAGMTLGLISYGGEGAAERIKRAFAQQPFNRNYLNYRINLAYDEKNFDEFETYSRQMLKFVPMQQTTYIQIINILQKFYNSDTITQSTFDKKTQEFLSAMEAANARMSGLAKYLGNDAVIQLPFVLQAPSQQ